MDTIRRIWGKEKTKAQKTKEKRWKDSEEGKS